METSASQEYREETATHRLGQYNAWELTGAGAIDLVWISKAHQKNPAAHRVLPHGEPSIAIRRKRDSRGEISSIDLTVCGPYRQSSFYNPEPGEELIGIRLKPETAASCFQIAPADYFNCPPVTAPRAIYDACAASMLASEALDITSLIPVLYNDLASYAANRCIAWSPEAYSAALIRGSQGQVKMTQLGSSVGVSERHLRRRFHDCFGVSPKEYARQLRLTAVVLEAERIAEPDWASIAADFGFHDQSHMINEFQTILDLTPRLLHQERRALLNAE